MAQVLRKLFILSMVMGLLSCSGIGVSVAPPKEVKSSDMGLIFGNIRAPERITEVVLRKYGKIYIRPFNRPPRVLVYKNGDFMAENLEPGSYILSTVVTVGNRYNLIDQKIDAYQNIIDLNPGSVKYLGTYQIFDLRDEDGRREKFEMMSRRKPDERQIVKTLYSKSRGTGWQDLFNKRLMELR